MGKAKASKPAAAASSSTGGGSWISAKKRRKCGKYLLWVLGPLLAAAAIAILGSPEAAIGVSDEPASTTEAERSPSQPGKKLKAPPADKWANPSECQAWAGSAQCTENPQFMLENCAFSCAKLEYAKDRYNKRCPRPENYNATLAPGALSAIFARAMTFTELQPERISEDPPVILFHNFFTESEVEAFKRHGAGKYEKSLGVGMKADGTMGDVPTEIRTSAHGWCSHKACLDDPNVQRVVARVADLTQTPPDNAEFAQLVYYHACADPSDGKCAFYRKHNDYIDGDRDKLQGVRVFTLFGYLNDVPEGGGTRFTDLPSGPVLFQPQKGKAILWPSVLEDDPHSKDERTNHEALPVTKGEKFGANFWIHQYDFKGPHARGCTAG